MFLVAGVDGVDGDIKCNSTIVGGHKGGGGGSTEGGGTYCLVGLKTVVAKGCGAVLASLAEAAVLALSSVRVAAMATKREHQIR